MDITLLQIDEEFSSLLPPLTKEQISELEQLIDQHGWNEPLFYWEGKGVLIDGHHRYRIWHRDYRGSKLPGPNLVGLHFETRAEVMEWMVQHQDSRRNWTKEVRDEVIRKIYAEEVGERGGNRMSSKSTNTTKQGVKAKVQNEPLVEDEPPKSARQRVAEAVGVSESTVQRAVSAGKKAGDKEDSSASVVLDDLDREVPEALRESHATSSEILSAGTKLDQAKRLVKELAEKPGGEFLEVQAIEIALKEAKRLITQSRYWSECPRCKGNVGKTCAKCGKAGFLPWSLKQQLSDADRKYLGIPDF